MTVRESQLGFYPCLTVGGGMPLVVLAGLLPAAGVAPGLLRGQHERTAALFARGRQVFYVNRRPRMPRGATMAEIAAEHAAAMRMSFGRPVDLLGVSTGGSIAQQIAAEHPDVVRRLVLISTGCRLGPAAALVQRQVAARVRAEAIPQACAVIAADLAPVGPLALLAGAAGRLVGPRLLGREGLDDMATMAEAEDSFDLARLPPIQAPTLIIGGGRDRYYETSLVEETRRLIPNCRVEILPLLGHITVLSHPRTLRSVSEFLSAGQSSAPAPGPRSGPGAQGSNRGCHASAAQMSGYPRRRTVPGTRSTPQLPRRGCS